MRLVSPLSCSSAAPLSGAWGISKPSHGRGPLPFTRCKVLHFLRPPRVKLYLASWNSAWRRSFFARRRPSSVRGDGLFSRPRVPFFSTFFLINSHVHPYRERNPGVIFPPGLLRAAAAASLRCRWSCLKVQLSTRLCAVFVFQQMVLPPLSSTSDLVPRTLPFLKVPGAPGSQWIASFRASASFHSTVETE